MYCTLYCDGQDSISCRSSSCLLASACLDIGNALEFSFTSVWVKFENPDHGLGCLLFIDSFLGLLALAGLANISVCSLRQSRPGMSHGGHAWLPKWQDWGQDVLLSSRCRCELSLYVVRTYGEHTGRMFYFHSLLLSHISLFHLKIWCHAK